MAKKTKEVKIKECLVCQLNSKAARNYIEDRLDPAEYYGGSKDAAISTEMYDHMQIKHDIEIDSLSDKVWKYKDKLIEEAL